MVPLPPPHFPRWFPRSFPRHLEFPYRKLVASLFLHLCLNVFLSQTKNPQSLLSKWPSQHHSSKNLSSLSPNQNTKNNNCSFHFLSNYFLIPTVAAIADFLTPIMWFSDMGNRVGNGLKRSFISGVGGSVDNNTDKKSGNFPRFRHDKSQILGILAFETAKTMSRLLSLHKSLTNEEIFKLRNEIVKSEGVSYLISKDEEYLHKLACKEKLEEIDRAAVTVARLGRTCSDPDLAQFDRVYTDLKSGFIDLSSYFVEKEIDKTMDKLEKLTCTTADLYAGLESLAEMELSEKKIKSWNFSGQVQTKTQKKDKCGKANYDLFDQKLAWQRQRVRHLRQVSLWGQTFNKIVRLMARAICIVYARMCVVFSPFITLGFPSEAAQSPEHDAVRGPLLQRAGTSTAGGSGLSQRYANVVLIAEKYLKSRGSIEECGREELYQMLPLSLRRLMKVKLRKAMCEEQVGVTGGASLSEGWWKVSSKILAWLVPMAHHTIRWQVERNVEKQSFDARPKVLLLQTLYLADRAKLESAIADILVGLSCICKYEARSRSNPL